MNRLNLSLLALIVLLLTSCVDFDQNIVYGSGDIGDEYREPDSVLGVKVKIRCKVLIKYSDEIKVRLTGDKNILPLITTRTEGSNLVIDSTEAISFSKQLQIEIWLPQLSQVIVAGHADVLVSQGSYGDNIELIMDGSGSIKVEESYFYLITAVMNGSGSIYFNGQCSSLTGIVNGAGYIEAKGNCDKLNLTMASGGSVRMSEFTSYFCTVISTGGGECRVRVTESITAVLQSIGNIYLYGTPPTVNLTRNGSGDLIRVSDRK